ncbi:hypothetical protein N7532_010243 [Penicillium argentinense]|uniref:Phosphatidylglycerol lysyltransferase C-terminal domain-containing protein n=1 Tax=Penicillium argentinense TaxID=1131581 RepID=A0A9W9JYC1_9EURO|nr:uncharacterized protein N7532_010243 [Penicillium argentinense]KAJ5085472.1 hypothetical protein N7532_010243 [Penicillium argentinense]
MASHAPTPTGIAPPIMVTEATDINMQTPISVTAVISEKKRRGRKGRKPNPVNISGPNPKKSLLLDELGDALVDQLYTTPKLDDRLGVSNASVVDHLRKNLTTSLKAPSCASSITSSSRTLTGVESSTPPTSLDERDAQETTLSSSRTVASHSYRSNASLRTNHTIPERGNVFSLTDFSTMTAIQRLTAQYGRVAHMGILDHSYRFFVNKTQTAALSFKVQNRIAIVGGDPLCEQSMIPTLVDEFSAYRKKRRWGLAFMGASASFVASHAQPRNWTTIRFGTERVLNPQTNEVLHETSGKRIAVQNRQLLHPQKGGITLGVYAPSIHGTDSQLQSDLISLYNDWRAERNDSNGPQAFITVYDPFALPSLMTFVYTRSATGMINGFAALRRLGCGGYHIDPCIASPGSPKGISDLLIVSCMALLHRANVSYLGFGFEPVHALSAEDVTGMSGTVLTNLTRDMYGHTFQRLPIHGKKAYHDKFRPDEGQDSGLYLVFPGGIPSPRHFVAMIHMANISLRKIFWADFRDWVSTRKGRDAKVRHKASSSSLAGDQ